MGARSDNVTWHAGVATAGARAEVTGGPGATVWITGLPASGKSTVAVAAEAALLERGRAAYLLDGDNLRHGLNGNLGFVPEERAENVRRTAHVAALLADAGSIAIVSLVSPYASDRAAARAIHRKANIPFLERTAGQCPGNDQSAGRSRIVFARFCHRSAPCGRTGGRPSPPGRTRPSTARSAHGSCRTGEAGTPLGGTCS